jgi:MscS family membrane protein
VEAFLLQTGVTSQAVKAADFRLLFDLIIFSVITIMLFKFIDYFTRRIKRRLEEKDSSLARFIPAFERFTKGLVLFFMLATLLQSHGYSMTSIIAGFGITGLAAGFAAKETIANIFGAIAILSDKSFKLGDYISINGTEGTVEDINMRSTKIRSLDNSIVIFPNSLAANSVIKNISQIKKRRIIETVGITYDTKQIRRAVSIIEEIFASNPEVTKDCCVFVERLAESSINIKMNAAVKTNDYVKYSKIKEQILIEIVEKFRKEKIELAFPTQTLHVNKI